MKIWYLYILKCSDSSFYTGITTDLEKRIVRHNSGDGAKYTRSRRPVKLVYTEKIKSQSEAKKREIEVKTLSRENKKRLMKEGSFTRLKK
ncbi:MAG: GIY-YIG nuclease family protein [Candidatus Omnitrophica bacterium]|nr:GIY-YIG nuclease family protein [Candidatus Omnitrophota bacterium]HOX54545.1 GIY-YIG nuclease family protein [Candidatus Omnitrophota bacterium]